MKFNITIQDIIDLKPCYDPVPIMGESWSGTLEDVLNWPNVDAGDLIWVVKHFAGDKVSRLFAVDCARRALSRLANPDSRSIRACKVALAFASDNATKSELRAAYADAADAYAAADADAYADAYAAYAAAAASAAAASAYASAYAAADAADAYASASADAVYARTEERKLQIASFIRIIKECQ